MISLDTTTPSNENSPSKEQKPSKSVFPTVKESVYRGNWQAQIETYTGFGRARYLPTPQPVIKQKEPEVVKEDDDATTTHNGERQRLLCPPPGRDVKYSIVDREKDFRAWIEADGACFNNLGDVIGYLNLEDKQAGSVDEMLLGYVQESRFDNVATLLDADDTVIARVDLGTHVIRNAQGVPVVDIEQGGVVKHQNGTFLGQFSGAKGFHAMREIALYMVLLDPGMCSDVSG